MQSLNDLSNFKTLHISLASPEQILGWSHGEVTKPETINYRTFKPEKDGLFDERIFGPTKDFECYCGKYKRIRYKGVICDKCGVEVTYSRVRRERMGHINLASPVAHVWYFRGIPSQMGILLDLSPRDLESIIYFSSHLITQVDPDKKVEVISLIEKTASEKLKLLKEDFEKAEEEIREKIVLEKDKVNREGLENKGPLFEEIDLKGKHEIAYLREKLTKDQDETAAIFKDLLARIRSLNYLSVISDAEYLELSDDIDRFAKVKMGAEALLYVLKEVDVNELSKSLKKRIGKASGQRRIRLIKKLKVVEGFKNSGVNPQWMILRDIAVIPPELRPMVQLEGGRFATSDLNDLYRRVINRNNRLKRLLELGAPEIIIRNEKRMLQESVDSLIDSSKQRGSTRPARGKQELRSLSDMLKGKQGRFRRNLLGKRVDYSGRSVIVVGPHLRLNQCGLPKEMVLELFKPFVLREILKVGLAPNLKSARFVLESRVPEVWDILERLVSHHPVMLNRAPTLHRLGIQAFYPILIDGSAIQIHPCVCSGYNADFDGDQMAVHVPLSANARKEATDLMLSSKNLLLPASGAPITLPNRDMIVGAYYLTTFNGIDAGDLKRFSSTEEVFIAYDFGKISLREPIKLRLSTKDEITTSVGRLIFSSILPGSFGIFNEETNKENGAIKKLVEGSFRNEGREKTVELIDGLKEIGFKYATLSGFSMGIMDGKVPEEKTLIIEEADRRVAEIDTNFRRGLITKREKLRLIENVWSEVTNKLDELVWSRMSPDNPIKAMVRSGARGTRDQVKQIAGIRGLIVDPLGRLVELPIRSNYVEGLTGFEYFASARGARKGLVDTALKTADAGYLTRRLIDVAQEVIIRRTDCGTDEGIEIIRGEEHLLTSFGERIYGRVLASDVYSATGKKLVAHRGDVIKDNVLQNIDSQGIKNIKVRSPLTCEATYGICSLCYGMDLATRDIVSMGSPVGIIAAQSIGEPGTQLTLRTRHTGGIATSKDVTQGLPRVEELFEARTPKFLGVISEIDGKVRIEEFENKKRITVEAEKESGQEDRYYDIDPTTEIKVKDGELVAVGTQLTEGYLDLSSVMRVLGVRETSKYIISEIQKVYSSQGVNLNDKHIEVIVRQMFSKVKIESSGDSKYLPGELISRFSFQEENEGILSKSGEPAIGEIVLLGITKASLETDSFLAAASFMETTRVLTEASISGRTDRLLGLKENVIIGRLIPVGEVAKIE